MIRISVFAKIVVAGSLILLIISCGSSPSVSQIENPKVETPDAWMEPLTTPSLVSVTRDGPNEFTCRNASTEVLALCDAFAPDWKENQPDHEPFRITVADVDLNEDGINEKVVWESSWAGTSGGLFGIFQTRSGKLVSMIRDELSSCWSPIIKLPKRRNGWCQIAYLSSGGGVKTSWVILTFKGEYFAVSSEMKTRPEGKVLIEQSWQPSTFGPREN